MAFRLTAIPVVFLLLLPLSTFAESLHSFSEDFWEWRAREQPFTVDDIPRIERPVDFSVDWSAAAIERRRAELAQFQTRLDSLEPANYRPLREQVDHRVLESALARVRWELEIERSWQRNPLFYVDQTLGSVYVLLLSPPPFGDERQRQIVARMNSIPATLKAAVENLTDAREPFARLAIESLKDLPQRCDTMNTALGPLLSPENRAALLKSTTAAVQALESYRSWLQERLPSMRKETAIGTDNCVYFLRNVALMTYSPEQLLEMSRQEWNRTVAFESYEHARNADLPPAPLFPSQAAQIEREAKEEMAIRAFLVKRKILSVPATMKHYRNLPLPAYVEPFAELGVTDDLTGPSRLDQDGTSYIQPPSESLGFFSRAIAHDPRPIIVHEGVPGHYFQLCLGWAHPDFIRRHYYDSGANEGIGFYAEEMMLQAGLFDDSPHTRETIYSFMRLRALRVEADVKLASGEFTLEQAANYLAQTVPMDHATALDEATLFASTPGQAISYQIGKLQIVRLLADARRIQGDRFNLQSFHDFLWTNGNLPISLLRWELLGDATETPAPTQPPAGERQ